MFLLPSLFTVGNIAAGFFSITETINAISGNAHVNLDWAAIAILFAIPFDALDGRIARMTNTCSDFGKELDSLADTVTFGVAPTVKPSWKRTPHAGPPGTSYRPIGTSHGSSGAPATWMRACGPR